MNHPVLTAIAASHAAFDEIAGVDPIYMSVGEKKAAMVETARLRARADALELQLLAAGAVDVADDTGARSTATWLADEIREAHGTVRSRAALAKSLDQRYQQVADALAASTVNLAQARAIVESLDALPTDLGDGLLMKAEAFLVEKAAEFGPRELRHLGRGVLQHLAPEVADQAEYQRLRAEERRARADTRLFFRPRGDGSTDVSARVPDHVANRLRSYLDAIASPRRPGNDSDFMALPPSRRRGIAFQWLLEKMPAKLMPRHGGSATTVSVKIDYATLIGDLGEAGVALTSTGDQITAGQARRLACHAGIIPFVMGGKSVILDQGRKKRLYDDNQRLAKTLLTDECSTAGCTIPAAWCDFHHKVPWSEGGRTDLDDGAFLCPFHHDRAHDPDWTPHYHPDDTTTFTRRQ